MISKKRLEEIYEKEHRVYGLAGTKIYKVAPKYYIDQDKDIFEDLFETKEQAEQKLKEKENDNQRKT